MIGCQPAFCAAVSAAGHASSVAAEEEDVGLRGRQAVHLGVDLGARAVVLLGLHDLQLRALHHLRERVGVRLPEVVVGAQHRDRRVGLGLLQVVDEAPAPRAGTEPARSRSATGTGGCPTASRRSRRRGRGRTRCSRCCGSPRLFLVPTTLNNANTLSSLMSDCTFVTVCDATYASSLADQLDLVLLAGDGDAAVGVRVVDVRLLAVRIALNGAYVPDCGKLVPIVIVSPLTPVVSLSGGHVDVSMIDPVDPLPAGGRAGRVDARLRGRPVAAARGADQRDGGARARPRLRGAAPRRTGGTATIDHGDVLSFWRGWDLGSQGRGCRRSRLRRDRSVRPAMPRSRRPPPTMPSGSTYISTIRMMPKSPATTIGFVQERRRLPTSGCTTTAKPPMSGPITVAVPPITTATRNSIEIWKVTSLSSPLAFCTTSTEHRAGDARVHRARARTRSPSCGRGRCPPTPPPPRGRARRSATGRSGCARAGTRRSAPTSANANAIMYAHWSCADKLGREPPAARRARCCVERHRGWCRRCPSRTGSRGRERSPRARASPARGTGPSRAAPGKPTSAPITNVTAAATGTVARNDLWPKSMPNHVYWWSISSAVMYAPIPKNAPCPIDTWPL